MTSVVASLIETSIEDAAESARVAFAQGADLVEARLDHITGMDKTAVREARRAILGPTIATLRSKDQGGRSALEPTRRKEILEEILQSDFEYVDLELDTDRTMLKRLEPSEDGPDVIVSHHFDSPAPKSSVEKKLLEALSLGSIAKVAMPCESAPDALMLASIGTKFSRMKKKFSIIGMGDQGQLTRVFANEIGSKLAYACLEGREAAPGQLDLKSQIALQSATKKVFGLIGHPVSHSVSKPMQEEALKNRGIPGVYLALDFPPGKFDGNHIRTMKSLGFAGLNVTIPHKSAAFRICDKKKEAALATGAVNTILFDRGAVVGENTDVIGFSRLLDGKININKFTTALVIGAGGAAKAAAFVLTERGARLTISDIENEKAVELSKRFNGRPITVKRLWKSKQAFNLVVNCSPVGMKGVGGIPIKGTFLSKGSVYIDVVYNPPVTRAMELAQERGASAHGGLEMLVQQGAESFRLWTGLEPNVEAMREAARRALA